jgi:hydrogenase maturation factor HypF (carbamoyltransferase family)
MMQQLMQLKMLPESKWCSTTSKRWKKKGADIINLENQRILDEENYTTDYALQTERERIRYEAELAAANKSGADTTLITAKHALAKEKIEEKLQASKVAALGASLGIVSDILGKESAAGSSSTCTSCY